MFDHVGLNVKDYAASRAFYEQALAPLGWKVVMAFDEWKAAGFGEGDKPDFWITEREPYGTGTHVSHSQRWIAWQSTRSMRPRSPRAVPTTARLASARCTTRPITERSCSTSMGTTSRPSATRRSSAGKTERIGQDRALRSAVSEGCRGHPVIGKPRLVSRRNAGQPPPVQASGRPRTGDRSWQALR